jgi:hypothetical protein
MVVESGILGERGAYSEPSASRPTSGCGLRDKSVRGAQGADGVELGD